MAPLFLWPLLWSRPRIFSPPSPIPPRSLDRLATNRRKPVLVVEVLLGAELQPKAIWSFKAEVGRCFRAAFAAPGGFCWWVGGGFSG